jgi:REP-associated tyrosine transposase
MPFRTETFVQGNYYHIFNRGVNREVIFSGAANYHYLQQLLLDYSIERQIGIVSYCLMPNHFHLLLYQNNQETISEFINVVFNAYVQSFNKQQHRRGPLFEGRFKHVHVDRQEYLLHLMRYIHLNPVIAGLVHNPEEWWFSDYGLWVANLPQVPNLREVEWERVRYFRSELGIPSPHEYKKFVRDYMETRERERELAKYLFK